MYMSIIIIFIPTLKQVQTAIHEALKRSVYASVEPKVLLDAVGEGHEFRVDEEVVAVVGEDQRFVVQGAASIRAQSVVQRHSCVYSRNAAPVLSYDVHKTLKISNI